MSCTHGATSVAFGLLLYYFVLKPLGIIITWGSFMALIYWLGS